MATALTIAVTRTSRDADLLSGWLREGATDAGVRARPRAALAGPAPAGRAGRRRRGDDRGGAGARRLGSSRPGGRDGPGGRPTAEAKAAAWGAMAEDPEVSNRMFAALAEGLWSPEQAELGAPYVVKYLEAARPSPPAAARGSPTSSARRSRGMRLDDAQLDALRAALAGRGTDGAPAAVGGRAGRPSAHHLVDASLPDDGQPFVNP